MFRIILTICSILIFIAPVSSFAKDLDGTPYTPSVDPDIDMYFGSWKESMPRHSHGSLIERDVLN